MLSPSIEDMAEIDQSLPVQMEGLDGSASYLREAQNTRKIVAPSEVLFPAMNAWVVQRYQISTYRVASFCFYGLMPVATIHAATLCGRYQSSFCFYGLMPGATLAGEGQIF